MRQLSLIAVFAVVGGVLVCHGQESPTAPSTDSQSPTEEYDPLAAQLQSLEQMLAEIGVERRVLREFPEQLIPVPVVPDNYQDAMPDVPRIYQYELPRNWMNCDGYITNNVTAGYCEDSPPSSWGRFRFNGELYFFVPLGPSA